ncbi:MAG: hypothetical protein ACHQQR_04000 [Gemmatimonadales bacterium]
MRIPRIFPGSIAFAAAAACGGRAKQADVPRADLIVTTADSSYWVTGGPQGLRVRGVPMLLARVEGRFRELYVADDDRSYFDAVLVGQRLWSRDLVRGDSVELFADTVVPRYAKSYAKAHPDDTPLAADEETSEHPRTTVTAELEVLGVHGPYVSYEYRTDMDVTGGRTNADRHTARRGVLDMRTGRAVTVAALFGGEAAARAERDALTEWRIARDSLLALRDRRSRRAQRAIASFDFDPRSFTIESRDGAPLVVYAVPGEVSRGSLSALALDPREVPAMPWWSRVRDELPAGPDSLLSWKHDGLQLRAALSNDGELARLTLRDSARRDWRVAAVAAPVWRVLWLDAGVNADDRKALKRAFNDASMYSDDSRIALAPRRAKPRSGFVLASFHRP